jgi:hypothetical protein
MVIAGKLDRHVWGMVNVIVHDALTDTADLDGGLIHSIHATVVMNVIVFGDVVGTAQGRAIASIESDAAIAGAVDVTMTNAHITTPRNDDTPATEIAKGAALDSDFLCILNLNRIGTCVFEIQILNMDVPGAIDGHRLGADGYGDLGAFHVTGRPQVEDARVAIEIPLTWFVEFTQQVVGVEPLTSAVAITMRWWF